MAWLAVTAFVLGTTSAAGQGFEFPGRVETFPHGHYWSWGAAGHGGGPNDSQLRGHDFGMTRFDTATNAFTPRRPARPGETVDGTENDHELIWNQPVYAHRGGIVSRCWAEAPDNPAPGVDHARVGEIFPGGNMVWIDHEDGTVTLYAHFREGTVPPEVCTNRDPFHPNPSDANADVAPGGERRVEAGQFLGCVGNSGSSTSGPHLHIHTYAMAGGTMGPDFGPAVAIPFRSVRTKSASLTRDVPNDWRTTTNAPLPEGRELLLPAPIEPQYPPRAWIGMVWNDFLPRWQQAEADGYRLHDLEVHRQNGVVRFSGIFTPGDDPPLAWVGLGWDDFLARWQQAEADGFRLHDFESWRDGNRRVYGGIFRPGTNPPLAWVGLGWDDFLARWQQAEADGFRLHDLETWRQGDRRVYAGIFVPGSYAPAAWVGLPFNDFVERWGTLEGQGYRIHDLETWVRNGTRVYAGVFSPGTNRPAAWINQRFNVFLPNWTELELLNYRMSDLETTAQNNELRMFGIFDGGPPPRNDC